MSGDLIDAGTKFNEAVKATGVVGGLRADFANVQNDVSEIKRDVKAIKTTMSEWTGSLRVWAAIPGGIAIAVSLYAAFFK